MTNGKRLCNADVKIGRNLRALRKEKNLTTAQICNGLGLTWTQLYKYEAGKNRISLTTAYRLSLLLDVELTRLLKGVKVKDLNE